LGGFPGWVAAGGETEPVTEATNATPQPNTNTQPATAPPNPTTNDGKTPATVAPKGAEGTPAGATTQATTKTTKGKKSKHRRTKPGGD